MLRNKLRDRSGVSRVALVAVAIGIMIVLGAGTARSASSQTTPTQRVLVFLRSAGTTNFSAVRNQVTSFAQTLRSEGATHITTGKAIPYFAADVTATQQAALAANPAVKAVYPDAAIHLASPLSARQIDAMQGPSASTTGSRAAVRTAGKYSICGTASSPEKDPEALDVINAQNPAYDGAGVKVAYIAGHINTTISDFQRNPKYVGPGSPSGPGRVGAELQR